MKIYTEREKEQRRAAHRRWMGRNPGIRKEYYRKYDEERYDTRTPKRMFISARSRAIKNNLDFNLEIEDVQILDQCPICDKELKSAKGVRGGSRQSPTLDRIHNDKGYVKGNVAVICKNCNSQKGHATSVELRRIADWMDTHN